MFEPWVVYIAAAAIAQIDSAKTNPTAQKTNDAPFSATHKRVQGNPYAAYQSGRFEDAFEGFADLQAKKPRDVSLMLNTAASLYRLQDYAGAQKALSLAAEHGNKEEREQALYDMGNCAFKQGQLEEALKHFQAALALDANDRDAKHNLDVTQRVLQKQQNQDTKNDDKKDSKNQDQPQDSQNNAQSSPRDPNDGAAADSAAAQNANQSSPSAAKPPKDANTAQDPAEQDAGKQADHQNSAAKSVDTDAATDPVTGEAQGHSQQDSAQQPNQNATAKPGRQTMTRAQAERLLDAMGESRPRHEKPSDEKARQAPGGKDW